MPSEPILVPALGEGIRDARVVAILRETGRHVDQDEPIVEVETDKATFVIESPTAGVVGEWQVVAGEFCAVGTRLTEILTSRQGLVRNGTLSPRHRAERARATFPSPPSRRLPAQVASVETHANWDTLAEAAARVGCGISPVVAWCAERALSRHPWIQAPPGGSLIGVAVAMLRDGLAISGIENAGDLAAFIAAFERAVSHARRTGVQSASCAVVFSDMSSFAVRSAAPIVAPPSVATLFLGSPFDVPAPSNTGIRWTREAKLALAFRHDKMNGAGAARLLRDIRQEIELIEA